MLIITKNFFLKKVYSVKVGLKALILLHVLHLGEHTLYLTAKFIPKSNLQIGKHKCEDIYGRMENINYMFGKSKHDYPTRF